MRRERITITLKGDAIKQLESLIDGKKIKNRSNAIETLIRERFKDKEIKTAVLVGSGFGIEIDGKNIAKVLMPIAGRTLLERNIKTLRLLGVEEVVLAVGSWRSEIEEVAGNGESLGVKIIYLEKEEGTAGVLRHLKGKATGTFLVANNDILLESIDIGDMFQFHKKNQQLATVAVAAVPDPSRLGSIFMKGALITGFFEKPKDKAKLSLMINAGVYLFEPDVLNQKLVAGSMLETDVFPELARLKKLGGYPIDENWVHLHDEARYKAYLASVNRKG